jgi:hypothetical protein
METGKNLPSLAVGVGYNYMNFDQDRMTETKDKWIRLF